MNNYREYNGRPAPLTYLGWRDSIAEELARTDPNYIGSSDRQRCYDYWVNRETSSNTAEEVFDTIEEAFNEELKAEKERERHALDLLKAGKL